MVATTRKRQKALTPGQELQEQARKAHAAHMRLCREDVNAFAEYVMRDEATGEPLRQAPVHEEWHRLADAHDRCLLWSMVGAGKTVQMSIIRTLWELGRDPNLRFLILSNTVSQAIKIARPIQQMIESSAELHEVFPGLRKSSRDSDPWNQTAMTVERTIIAKDPSIQVMGVRGPIIGSRLDRVVIDDILDVENTRTQSGRDSLADWVFASITSRLEPTAKVLCVGTAFHPQDLMHRLMKLAGWVARQFPVVNAMGALLWEAMWPQARIDRRRSELPPVEFARQMLCVARDDATSRFKAEWIQTAMERGKGRELAYGLQRIPSGCAVYTGVDLAVSLKDSADFTAFFTILVHPNQDREVLDVTAGRWTGPDILKRLVDIHNRYHGVMVVESNAAQKYLIQFANASTAIPIRPYNTGKNKTHPEFGIESIATELANGKWIIPNRDGTSVHPEIAAWLSELLYYDPSAHTGDRLMACFFSREAAAGRVAATAQTGRINKRK